MSLGGPSQSKNRIAPPERGSFPLDHEGKMMPRKPNVQLTDKGDCKAMVKEYLTCIKTNRGQNTPCRGLAKKFLKCRMDHGLMGQDEFKSVFLREGGTIAYMAQIWVSRKKKSKRHRQLLEDFDING